jgi:hypothetical protein
MRRQIIAKINNIANQLDVSGFYVEANALTNVMKKLAMDRDFDEEGSYDEMFGPMNDDPESDIPVKSGRVIVQYSGDDYNSYQSTYTVYVFIEEDEDGEREMKLKETINTYKDENGDIKILHDRNKANEVAKSMRKVYPDVSLEVQLSAPKRPNPRIPGDFERD